MPKGPGQLIDGVPLGVSKGTVRPPEVGSLFSILEAQVSTARKKCMKNPDPWKEKQNQLSHHLFSPVCLQETRNRSPDVETWIPILASSFPLAYPMSGQNGLQTDSSPISSLFSVILFFPLTLLITPRMAHFQQLLLIFLNVWSRNGVHKKLSSKCS